MPHQPLSDARTVVVDADFSGLMGSLETDGLATWASRLTFAQLPERARVRAELALIDHLGCTLYGMSEEWTRAVREHAIEGDPAATSGTRPSAVYGYGDGLAAAGAARVMGTAAHGFELDDIYQPALLHPASVVISAAVASCSPDTDGRRLLTAVVCGYEVMARVASTIGTWHSNRGQHGTSLVGPLGAAAAVGNLLGLDPARMRDAWGIAASLGGGIKAFQTGGGMVKRLHAGFAAEHGVVAAELAAAGVSGPVDPILGKNAFAPVYSNGSFDAGHLTASAVLAVENIYFKRYPACGAVHAAIAAAETAGIGVDVADVERIHVSTSGRTADQNDISRPRDVMGAQYSIRYGVALALLGEANRPDSYRFPRFEQPDVLGLVDKIVLHVDPELDADFPARMGGGVRLELRDGRSPSHLVPDLPYPDDEDTAAFVETKFTQLFGAARPTVGSCAQVLAAARDLRSGGRTAALMEATRFATRPDES